MQEDLKFKYVSRGKDVVVNIIKSDFESELIKDVLDIAIEALEKYNIESDLSDYIKRKLDENLDEYWHVVIGSDFSVSLTHNSQNFLFFLIEKMYFLLFRL